MPDAPPEIRFLCFAPSPYTGRHDALRAGIGIFRLLAALIDGRGLPLRAAFYDAMPAVEDVPGGARLLRGADVLVIGGSTWAQGSAPYPRRYFEHAGSEYLGGVAATAWATAGGAHTGGEVAIWDLMRTLMGMGAQVFSLGQKLMVFTMDEREVPPGDFTLLDCWYMDQFARNIAVVALARGHRERARSLSEELGVSTQFYTHLPRDPVELRLRYGALRDWLDAAADPASTAFNEMLGTLWRYLE